MKIEKKFSWYGIDSKGFKLKGELTACNLQEAKAQLKQQKITLLKIKQQWVVLIFLAKNNIKEVDITELSVEFATLISAGIPLISALQVMGDSARKSAMRTMLVEISKKIESGRSLSEAIQCYEHYFGKLFCNLVAVGEHAGTLDAILEYLAIYREKMAALRRKIKKALFYPGIVLIVALGVTSAMLIFVLPQFEQLFQGVGAELPSLTKAIIKNAHLLREYGGLLLVVVLIAVLLMRSGLQRFKSWQILFEKILLKLPVLGKILREAILARCFRTLATTMRAGLPLLDALELTANIAGHSLYQQNFNYIGQQIKNGKTLYFSFQSTQKFPQRAIQMIRIGEESGRLDDMLQKLGEYFENQVDYKVQNLSQLLEPALMIFLCLIIGTLVIAMYLPIFRLGTVL
jgi:type IV pilus assembly protein PilC